MRSGKAPLYNGAWWITAHILYAHATANMAVPTNQIHFHGSFAFLTEQFVTSATAESMNRPTVTKNSTNPNGCAMNDSLNCPRIP